MISKNMVKSKASSVHPSHAATQANHCSLVGSFHHATDEPERSAAVVMAFPPRVSQGSQVRIFGRDRPADGNARCAVLREGSFAAKQQRRAAAAEFGYAPA